MAVRARKILTPAVHLNLDEAWPAELLSLPTVDAREWGPQLRFSAPERLIERFFRDINHQLAPFVLYGSGDFHHLSALWLRRVTEPIIVVSFDNHPDWDVRPPRWCCGGWVNRALELPHVERVSVWGCGNFECWWPGQFFGNRRAERDGRLEVHPWADDRPAKDRQRRGAILQSDWRDRFHAFANEIGGRNVYVTVDLDCLQAGAAVTNWENGKFNADDIAWALSRLQSETRVIAGDICGAFSVQKYARATQRFAAKMDHPQLPIPKEADANRINGAAIAQLWPILAK